MNKKQTWITIIVILLVLLAGYWYFSKPAPASGEAIKIGYIGPFSGPVAGTAGEDVANGWKLAFSKNSIVGGRPIEVIYEDDACDPKQAVSAAQKLINVDKVKIIVNGVCSGSMLAAAPITESNKVVLFTPVSTSPKISDAGDYVFRTSGTGDHTAQAIIEGIKKFGYQKVAVIYEKSEYPVGIKDALLSRISQVPNGKIVTEEGVNLNETDMRSQLSKVSQSQPQVIVVLANSAVTANTFAKQVKELNIKIPAIGNEYFAFDVVVNNNDADGIYATQYTYNPESRDYRSFLADYEKEYRKTPSQAIYAALAFDGYNVLVGALDKCDGDDPSCVRDRLYEIKNFEGITGTITIDNKGDTVRGFTLRKISNGKLVDIK